MKAITTTLNEDDQAIIHRALTNLARSTKNDGFKAEVNALRKRLEDEGKE